MVAVNKVTVHNTGVLTLTLDQNTQLYPRHQPPTGSATLQTLDQLVKNLMFIVGLWEERRPSTLPGVRRPECEADQSHPSNTPSITLTPSICIDLPSTDTLCAYRGLTQRNMKH